MKKAVREQVESLRGVAASFGASIVNVSNNGHTKLQIKLGSGREFTHTICSTPGDRRSSLNDLKDFRRRLRELCANG